METKTFLLLLLASLMLTACVNQMYDDRFMDPAELSADVTVQKRGLYTTLHVFADPYRCLQRKSFGHQNPIAFKVSANKPLTFSLLSPHRSDKQQRLHQLVQCDFKSTIFPRADQQYEVDIKLVPAASGNVDDIRCELIVNNITELG